MSFTRWNDQTSFLQNAVSVITIVGLLLILAFFTSCKYLAQETPQEIKPLLIQMYSFSVLNFSIKASAVEAEWKAYLKFSSQDDESEIFINHPFETYLYYRDRNPPCLMYDVGGTNTLHLKQGRKKKVSMKFNSTSCRGKQSPLKKKVLKEIWKEKKKGNVVVNLKMNMKSVRYKTETRKWDLKQSTSCSNIYVDFVGARYGHYLGHHHVGLLNYSISW
jgi:hypothetical protein